MIKPELNRCNPFTASISRNENITLSNTNNPEGVRETPSGFPTAKKQHAVPLPSITLYFPFMQTLVKLSALSA